MSPVPPAPTRSAGARRRPVPAPTGDEGLSRRPSRDGLPAGTGAPPSGCPAHAGFPALLTAAVERARSAAGPREALDCLLTLGGHVPAEVSRRALTPEEQCGLAARFDRPGRVAGSEPPAFVGPIGFTVTGKVAIGVPTRRHLDDRGDLFDVATTVAWSRDDVDVFRVLVDDAGRREARELSACRAWLAARSATELGALVEDLRNAAARTAPFVLYRGHRVYTNFREPNNLTGKSLLRTHPDCRLHGLEHLPLDLWGDDEVLLTVCLTLLVRSGGYGRIEECNGTQLDLRSVAQLFAECWEGSGAGALPRPLVAACAGAGPDVGELAAVADLVRRRREDVRRHRLVYREIHGPLLHKRERVAADHRPDDPREAAVAAELAARLPVPAAGTLEEVGAALRADDAWLLAPHGPFATGLERLVHEMVATCGRVFDADFAMSRGTRSLTGLVEALVAGDWGRLVRWELPDYFCCVVASPSALPVFGWSWTAVADAAWAISARMQYNSWHFLPGNLPPVPVVEARDWFVPPTMPDVAHFSDQHHRGHVANHVRFSIRSPQAVEVLDRRFAGFVDLRLLRCVGPAFTEQDLVTAHRCSRLVAVATELAAARVARGERLEVTSFDHRWHLRATEALATVAATRSPGGGDAIG